MSYVHQKTCMRMFRTTVHNSPELETIQTPKNRLEESEHVHTDGTQRGSDELTG